jgi:hypothetical protein
MRVPMLILALVAAPLLSHDAQAQWWNRRSTPSQNGQQGNKDKEKDKNKGNHEQKGDHKGNNDDRPTATASISGTVYNDVDGSMSYSPGEAGLSGWTIQVTSGATTLTATTSATGTYSLTGLGVGSYSVCALVPSGWAANSQPRCWTADVTTANASASFTAFDFGAIEIPNGGVIF